MKVQMIAIERLRIDPDLTRSSRSKKFAQLLEASIREVGLAEPLKVAKSPTGGFLIVDGVLRFEAILRIRAEDPSRFQEISAILFPHSQRHEIRFQTDIFQNLLPSQLASMVELLHSREGVPKHEIAASLGIAPATLRNYTGVWRLSSRGTASRAVVELMDARVIPSSNPFAWLRLTEAGIEQVFRKCLSATSPVTEWTKEIVRMNPELRPTYPASLVEEITGSLAAHYYRQDASARFRKKTYGKRHARIGEEQLELPSVFGSQEGAGMQHLQAVAVGSPSLVLRTAARALEAFLT